jgi:hypothetical protein
MTNKLKTIAPKEASTQHNVAARMPQRILWIPISTTELPDNLLSRTPPCFGRHVKPLVHAAFAVVSHQPALGPRGLWPVLLMCNP